MMLDSFVVVNMKPCLQVVRRQVWAAGAVPALLAALEGLSGAGLEHAAQILWLMADLREAHQQMTDPAVRLRPAPSLRGAHGTVATRWAIAAACAACRHARVPTYPEHGGAMGWFKALPASRQALLVECDALLSRHPFL